MLQGRGKTNWPIADQRVPSDHPRGPRIQSHAATSKWLIIIRNSIQVVLRGKKAHIGRFYTKDALSVRTNFGKHFEVRLVMRLKYKDGRKTHYASRRTTIQCVVQDVLRMIIRPDA